MNERLTIYTAVDTRLITPLPPPPHIPMDRVLYIGWYYLPGEVPASGCISCQGDGSDRATYLLLMWLRTCALVNCVSFGTTTFFDVYAPHFLRTQGERHSRIYFWVHLRIHFTKPYSAKKGGVHLGI
ncbi:unnamed protein product [Ectocarpus sp. 12 AP-2014]